MFDEELSPLWVEKYRPRNINEYVFKNPQLKSVVQNWIQKQELPSLLLMGPAGTGKTSLLHVLINEIKSIDPSDVLELNMSDQGMDAIRDVVLPFIQTRPFGKFKVVILEEFEQCSQKGQGSLKRIMEEYSAVARFLITSNAPNKILPPIRSRVQEIQIDSHDYNEFLQRIIDIIQKENIQIGTTEDLERVESYIKTCYPDFRKCINTLQQNCVGNKLVELNSATSGTANFENALITAIKNGNLSSLRETIIQTINEEEISAFFTFLYKNVDIWLSGTDDEIRKIMLIIKIRDGLVKDTLCADRYMNMSAVLCDLQLIALGK
jgi:replication factor C small subunit